MKANHNSSYGHLETGRGASRARNQADPFKVVGLSVPLWLCHFALHFPLPVVPLSAKTKGGGVSAGSKLIASFITFTGRGY